MSGFVVVLPLLVVVALLVVLLVLACEFTSDEAGGLDVAADWLAEFGWYWSWLVVGFDALGLAALVVGFATLGFAAAAELSGVVVVVDGLAIAEDCSPAGGVVCAALGVV